MHGLEWQLLTCSVVQVANVGCCTVGQAGCLLVLPPVHHASLEIHVLSVLEHEIRITAVLTLETCYPPCVGDVKYSKG